MKKLRLIILTTIVSLVVAWIPCYAGGLVTVCDRFGSTHEPETLAGALVGGGTVTFACDGTIIVTPQIIIRADTIIDATGRNIVLSGDNSSSVFWVFEEWKLDLKDLTITKGGYYGAVRNLGGTVSMKNCAILSTSSDGGGIKNNNGLNTYLGTMTLTNTIVSDNKAGIINFGNMTLTDCTVTRNGSGSTLAGGIQNGKNSLIPGSGVLTLINTTVSYNTASSCGGIGNSSGQLTLMNSSVIGNSATSDAAGKGDAGGILNFHGSVSIKNSILSGNTATNRGGAIYAYGGTILIEDSTVSNNHSNNKAGGIFTGVEATLEITNSTISDNSSTNTGGGLHSFGGQVTITNSTLSGNSSFQGGGIYNYAPLTLNHVTFSSNSADQGSNLYIVNHSRSVTQMSNTLFANGLRSSNCYCPGSSLNFYLTDGGYNLADDDTCNLINSTTSMSNTDPLIDLILANNGGFTNTHALKVGSPAIDAIPDGANGCGDSIITDQRGIVRPQGDGCDIGAYESELEPDFDIKTTAVLSATEPDYTVTTGTETLLYGTFLPNHITLESGAKAELINFPGQNTIQIQSSSDLFTVSRSGTIVTFAGSDGTILKIPATTSVQTVDFSDRLPMTLSIHGGQVMLDDQAVTATAAAIFAGSGLPGPCGAFVAPNVWKEFDCYNLAAIGKTTNDNPFTPSWRLIGGYWQWGRKGPDSSQRYDTNTANFAHGPTGPGDTEANDGEISSWDDTYAPDDYWSDSEKTANDPCPAGYRVPTESQWDGVLDNNTQSFVGTWVDTNYSGARFFGNDLMLPAAGRRYDYSGSLDRSGGNGFYWSSTNMGGINAGYLFYCTSNAEMSIYYRTSGFTVRCVVE